MKSNTVRFLVYVAVAVLIAAVIFTMTHHTASSSEKEAAEEVDPQGIETIRLYCQVKTQLEMLNYAAQWSQTTFTYEPMPDDFETRPDEYKKILHHGYGKGNVGYLWEEGRSVDCFFDGTASELIPISQETFPEFVRDPFDPKGRPFQYALVPLSGEPNLILTISVGPDGDLDLDPKKLDARLPNLGFRTSPLNLVYDPTNGLMSRGDIVKFNSGDTYQAEMIDIFVKTWEEP